MSEAPLTGSLPLRTLAIAASLIFVASGTGSYVQNTLNPPRLDPFTGEQAEELRKELREEFARLEKVMRREFQFQLSYQRDLLMLQSRMPTQATRDRIAAIEKWVRSRDQEWTPPTTRWSEAPIEFSKDPE